MGGRGVRPKVAAEKARHKRVSGMSPLLPEGGPLSVGNPTPGWCVPQCHKEHTFAKNYCVPTVFQPALCSRPAAATAHWCVSSCKACRGVALDPSPVAGAPRTTAAAAGLPPLRGELSMAFAAGVKDWMWTAEMLDRGTMIIMTQDTKMEPPFRSVISSHGEGAVGPTPPTSQSDDCGGD